MLTEVIPLSPRYCSISALVRVRHSSNLEHVSTVALTNHAFLIELDEAYSELSSTSDTSSDSQSPAPFPYIYILRVFHLILNPIIVAFDLSYLTFSPATI